MSEYLRRDGSAIKISDMHKAHLEHAIALIEADKELYGSAEQEHLLPSLHKELESRKQS